MDAMLQIKDRGILAVRRSGIHHWVYEDVVLGISIVDE
jgi:hypothetical protein